MRKIIGFLLLMSVSTLSCALTVSEIGGTKGLSNYGAINNIEVGRVLDYAKSSRVMTSKNSCATEVRQGSRERFSGVIVKGLGGKQITGLYFFENCLPMVHFEYDTKGKLLTEYFYKDGKVSARGQDIIIKVYDSDGLLKSETEERYETFDKKIKQVKEYGTDGHLKGKTEYVMRNDLKPDISDYIYDEAGNLNIKAEISEGRVQSMELYNMRYWPDEYRGDISGANRMQYVANNSKNGILSAYKGNKKIKDLKVTLEGDYKDGNFYVEGSQKITVKKEYYPNGKIKTETDTQGNKKNGFQYIYDEKGNLNVKVEFKNDKIQKIELYSKEYWPDSTRYLDGVNRITFTPTTGEKGVLTAYVDNQRLAEINVILINYQKGSFAGEYSDYYQFNTRHERVLDEGIGDGDLKWKLYENGDIIVEVPYGNSNEFSNVSRLLCAGIEYTHWRVSGTCELYDTDNKRIFRGHVSESFSSRSRYERGRKRDESVVVIRSLLEKTVFK